MSKHVFFLLLVICCLLFVFSSPVSAQTSPDWTMAGANPKRTSWTPEEVRGNIGAVWYRPIEPFINYKTQIIAGDNKIFVSTARGLYAFNADTGATVWVYPTEVPLGNAPTYINGKLYVGSMDGTIHALDAATGTRIPGWNPYVALAGFETNPLVANGRVFAGNRDGYFYAFDENTGALIWKYKTGAAIRQSAALDDNGTIYFASEDLYGYALSQTGSLVWKSEKMLGDTFASFWPVVYRNWVVYSGGAGYFNRAGAQINWDDGADIQKDLTQNTGTVPGDWAPGTVTMDATPILNHYRNKPYRRRVFMLNRSDGTEYIFSNGSYIPFMFAGTTQSGAKYPPVVGPDDVIYSDTLIRIFYNSNGYWTPTGAVVGWKVGTPYISRVMDWGVKTEQAGDEPMAFSMGGKSIYWILCCDRESGAFDVSIPFGQPNRWWNYWGYGSRFSLFPNYENNYFEDDIDGWGLFGGAQGIYGKHGTVQNPWIPYKGKLYKQMGNAVIAAAPNGTAKNPLPQAATVATTDTITPPSVNDLKARLEEEVQKIITAGHLKPGLFRSNIGDFTLQGNGPDAIDLDHGTDYFSNPSDTVIALIRALPHLSPTLQGQTKNYLQVEMNQFPVDSITHVGFVEGADRQAAAIPPDQLSNYSSFGKQTTVPNNWPWYFPPINFYAAWKYATVFPNEALPLYNKMKSKLSIPPRLSDAELIKSPQVLNAHIAGCQGYLELEKLAGQPKSQNVQNEYNRLLALKINNFSVDVPYKVAMAGGGDHGKEIIFSRHFIYMMPELAAELKETKVPAAQTMLNRINTVAPYWFVAGYDSTIYEGTMRNLYDETIFNIFTILQPSYQTMIKYLDAPAFPRGDLFYIQNLVSTIEAAENQGITPGPTNPPTPTTQPPSPTPTPKPGDVNGDGSVDLSDLSILLSNYGKSGMQRINGDLNNDGTVNLLDLTTLLANFGR